MPLPTLLAKGAVKRTKHIEPEDVDSLDKIRAIDYIVKFIERRTASKSIPSKKRPKTMGDRIILLRSGTGSGKSTTVAPELYKKFVSKIGGNIIITQPRILTAIDKAQDMAHIFPELTLGYNIGYQTGIRSFKPRVRGITSMTTGILLNIMNTLTSIEFAKKYSFILIDEIHEKDINSETILFMIKKFLKEFWDLPDCPIFIFMSATFEPEAYVKYFQIPPQNFIEVEGRAFPITEHYPPYDINDYINYAIKTAIKIHTSNLADLKNTADPSDIIVFVKNKKDAKTIADALHKYNAILHSQGVESAKKYAYGLKGGRKGHKQNPLQNQSNQSDTKNPQNPFILPVLLNRQSFNEGGVDYRNLFSPIKYLKTPIHEINNGNVGRQVKTSVAASRKIIITTPIAETGITITSLKYCVDTGWVLSPEFNPDFGSEILLNKNITRHMALQRKGRVGRLAPGNWYPCYTEKTFKELPEDLHSKFISEDITLVLLNIIVKETQTIVETVKPGDFSEEEQKDLFRQYRLQPSWHKMVSEEDLDFSKLDFYTSPSASGLCYSLEKLYVLGLIDGNYNPTILGHTINQLRKVDIEPIRMVFAGYSHGANVLDLITISAFMQVERRNICDRKYQLRNPVDLDVPAYKFYNRVLIADEFIDCIFIWNEFMNEIHRIEAMINKSSDKSSKAHKFSINYLQKWCGENHLYYDGLLYVVSVRDELIDSLISVGINPYYNGMGLAKGTYNLNDIFRRNLEEGVDEIKKIKRCILDGYRMNIATWNKNINMYEMLHRNSKIKVSGPLVAEIATEQERPKVIVLSGIIIAPDFETISYKMQNSGAISVMDGFVDVDYHFLKK